LTGKALGLMIGAFPASRKDQAMPAAKPKHAAKDYDNKLSSQYENDPGLDPPMRNDGGDGSSDARFYAQRRHLAAAREVTDLEEVIKATLQRIYNRDGARIFKESAKTIQDDLAGWIKVTPGRSVVPSIAG
jgi:hypothetical protein